MTDAAFLKDVVDRPGGPAEYVSLFLSQGCHDPWAGAVVITGVTFLICMTTRGLLRSVTDRDVSPWVYYVPGVLLLMLENQYGYHLITSVALLTALAFAVVYVRMKTRRAWVRLAVFAALAAALYYLAGGMVVLFGVLCGVFEVWKSRAVVRGVTWMVTASALPLGVAAYSYDVGFAEAYAPLLPWRADVVDRFSAMLTLPEWPGEGLLALSPGFRWALLLFFPLAMMWTAGRGRTGGRRTGWSVLSFTVFLAAAGLFTSLSVNDTCRKRLLIDYYAGEGMWDGVLRTAQSLHPERHDAFVMSEVNRALYHTGRLPYEMFRYPQRIDADSLCLAGPVSGRVVQTVPKSGTVFFELGHVNLSQRAAYMALEVFGGRPDILKRLVRINVLKGRPGVARSLLNVLARNPLCRRWAADFRRRLDADPVTASDEEIRRVRPLMVTAGHGFPDVTPVGFNPEDLFLQLLAQNPDNRMAFEYLMGFCLLTRQTDKVLAHLGRLEDFGYSGIPRHYEEAVLLYQDSHPDVPPDLHGRHISDDARERMKAFRRDCDSFERLRGSDHAAAFEKLKAQHGRDYFFYFRFRFAVAETLPFRPDAVTGASP